ncbi:hypothetical protein NEOLEDRAFT_1201581 [Neolentinus lepideus HHB14362 ss-1]|uniref:Carrier domain-containing protein n=1 Tax=Neolentinus lepideus HHB14362 ss-1 TaxID=1314782 RepID=A0A165STJ7_9AGAM|nr:hypothetical protein NEOLEDRAFT_1201581 [Neolentinus lepideus HHB14362 ss-1]
MAYRSFVAAPSGNMCPSLIGSRFLPKASAAAVEVEDAQGSSSLKDIICKVLEVPPDDLAPDVPLTAHGLDSLSATSLSSALAHVVSISQIQLLADVTLQQLDARAEEAAATKAGSGEAKVSERQDEARCMHQM